jgi:hypothetical protein
LYCSATGWNSLRVFDAAELRALEQHRRLHEQVEHKHHGADEQNEELHGDLGHGVEQQAQPALRDGAAGQVALHLRLVAAEVGEEQERAADQAAPDIEAVVPVEVGGDRVEAAGLARQKHGVAERDRRGHQHDHGHQRNHQPQKDDAHLLHVRPRHGLDAAEHGVGDHHGAHQHRGGRSGQPRITESTMAGA